MSVPALTPARGDVAVDLAETLADAFVTSTADAAFTPEASTGHPSPSAFWLLVAEHVIEHLTARGWVQQRHPLTFAARDRAPRPRATTPLPQHAKARPVRNEDAQDLLAAAFRLESGHSPGGPEIRGLVITVLRERAAEMTATAKGPKKPRQKGATR